MNMNKDHKTFKPRRRGPMGGPMGGMMAGEKAKDFKGSLKKLMAYLSLIHI